MNVRRLGIIAVAIAINVLVLAWFGTQPPASLASSDPASRGAATVTLPVVHVYPSATELRDCRRARRAARLSSRAAARGA